MTLIVSIGGVLKCNSRQMFPFFINSRCAQEALRSGARIQNKAFHSLLTRKNSGLSLPTDIKFYHLRKITCLGKNLPSAVYFSNQNNYLGHSKAIMLQLSPTTLVQNKCPDPELNRGPLDLQSNALPTELSGQ